MNDGRLLRVQVRQARLMLPWTAAVFLLRRLVLVPHERRNTFHHRFVLSRLLSEVQVLRYTGNPHGE